MPTIVPALRRWLRRTAKTAVRPLAAPRSAVNEGWCACCREKTRFEETGVWLRDQYLCARCESIPRFRAINLTLDTYFPGWEQLELHESSPCNDFLRRYNARYSSSYFFEDVPLGSEARGTRCENLEQLTYRDNTFDLFVTQDVLEHVFHPDRAVAEIMRVVKPGGAHVFTTPKHKGLRLTTPRVALEQGEIRYLLDPQYHGNPIGDGRALVTWDYGDDFEAHLWAWCGYPTVTYVTRDRSLGLDGEYLDVFVTRKASLPLSARRP